MYLLYNVRSQISKFKVTFWGASLHFWDFSSKNIVSFPSSVNIVRITDRFNVNCIAMTSHACMRCKNQPSGADVNGNPGKSAIIAWTSVIGMQPLCPCKNL